MSPGAAPHKPAGLQARREPPEVCRRSPGPAWHACPRCTGQSSLNWTYWRNPGASGALLANCRPGNQMATNSWWHGMVASHHPQSRRCAARCAALQSSRCWTMLHNPGASGAFTKNISPAERMATLTFVVGMCTLRASSRRWRAGGASAGLLGSKVIYESFPTISIFLHSLAPARTPLHHSAPIQPQGQPRPLRAPLGREHPK